MDTNTATGNQQQQSNRDQQAVDKAPGEERGHAEQVTNEDLKGKKVDADPSEKKDQPSK